MKPKWDYQDNYSQWQLLMDEMEFWVWRHIHWLWWAYQSMAQWVRDKEKK